MGVGPADPLGSALPLGNGASDGSGVGVGPGGGGTGLGEDVA